MDDVIELENVVSDDGIRTIHLLSNLELTVEALKKYDLPGDAKIESKKEAGAYHLRASWLMQGLLKIDGEGWPAARLCVVWNFGLCTSVSKAIGKAAERYLELFGDVPDYAFVRALPKGIENGVEVGDVILFEAEWMMRRCVAVYSPGV